jgi:hypothetical protein
MGARTPWRRRAGVPASGDVSSLVLVEHTGPVVARVPLRARLSARLGFAARDAALAAGADPDTSAALALRARRLIAPRTRRRLAASLRRWVAAAGGRRGPHEVRPGPQVADAAGVLLALADRLEARGPVEARGVALVSVLLSDGRGPLHSRHGTEPLVSAARAAAAALDPRLPLAA